MLTQNEINTFRKHVEWMKSPSGYTLDNLGQFEFFMRRHGDDLLEDLEASSAYRMQAYYAGDVCYAALEEVKRLTKEICTLKSKLGTLKAKQ